jgi:hypothetical protein
VTVRDFDSRMRRPFRRRAEAEARRRRDWCIEGGSRHSDRYLKVHRALVIRLLNGDAVVLRLVWAVVSRQMRVDRSLAVVIAVVVFAVRVQEGAVECRDRHGEGEEPRDRATGGRQHPSWLHSMLAHPPKGPDNFLKV